MDTPLIKFQSVAGEPHRYPVLPSHLLLLHYAIGVTARLLAVSGGDNKAQTLAKMNIDCCSAQ